MKLTFFRRSQPQAQPVTAPAISPNPSVWANSRKEGLLRAFGGRCPYWIGNTFRVVDSLQHEDGSSYNFNVACNDGTRWFLGLGGDNIRCAQQR